MQKLVRRHPVLVWTAAVVLPAAAAAAALVRTQGWPALVAWLVPLNLLAWPVWWWDKRQARREGFRVPELALHLVALAGAVPGSVLAMQTLRHKTLKTSFRVLYAVFFVAQIAALWWWFERGKGTV